MATSQMSKAIDNIRRAVLAGGETDLDDADIGHLKPLLLWLTCRPRSSHSRSGRRHQGQSRRNGRGDVYSEQDGRFHWPLFRLLRVRSRFNDLHAARGGLETCGLLIAPAAIFTQRSQLHRSNNRHEPQELISTSGPPFARSRTVIELESTPRVLQPPECG